MSNKINVADMVIHIDDLWTKPLMVQEIVRGVDGERYAKFDDGGFWLIDRLKKVQL